MAEVQEERVRHLNDSYLEELIVRRELSINFYHYTRDYDFYASLPGWAKTTLKEHKEDERKLPRRARPELLRQRRPYFGQHDRGWKEREVFGKVRYMSAGGLERKAKPEEYVRKVEASIKEKA